MRGGCDVGAPLDAGEEGQALAVDGPARPEEEERTDDQEEAEDRQPRRRGRQRERAVGACWWIDDRPGGGPVAVDDGDGDGGHAVGYGVARRCR